jgi:alcohol dehydrogenase class IV
MNSGTGPAAAMSYPTGVHYKVPHGIGGGIFLPYIIKYNINNGFYGYGELYQKNKILNISPKEKSLNFLNEIKKNWIIFSVPKNLKKLKINYQKISLLTKHTYELKGALQQNPVKFDKKEIFNLFSELSGVKLK